MPAIFNSSRPDSVAARIAFEPRSPAPLVERALTGVLSPFRRTGPLEPLTLLIFHATGEECLCDNERARTALELRQSFPLSVIAHRRHSRYLLNTGVYHLLEHRTL